MAVKEITTFDSHGRSGEKENAIAFECVCDCVCVCVIVAGTSSVNVGRLIERQQSRTNGHLRGPFI
ncbi:hypothetical protein MSG28_014313 [Choristoneura fumiferana]|uniref:Uncharacterized protein n=1 Tax=Choristoneura fumiferana TaxID=7141 RepID=A0ACC0JGU0_CHOFU|nr:hypothetical protein MSG28_014313 [Choristoneura fumiferana]